MKWFVEHIKRAAALPTPADGVNGCLSQLSFCHYVSLWNVWVHASFGQFSQMLALSCEVLKVVCVEVLTRCVVP